jgi:glycosyltransferase involved in cell wall biosynthesis
MHSEWRDEYLRVSDIFIRPSRSEGMGNSFVEAMAAELPVIATQEGGISDFLFDEKKNPSVPSTGWAVSKDSPREIADAVNDILDRPDKTQEVIKTAKRLACEKYDWDLIAHNMNIQVFHRLIS